MGERVDVSDVLQKYSSRLAQQVETSQAPEDYSRDYQQFLRDRDPALSRYERWCRSLGSVIKVTPSKKDEAAIARSLAIAHLDVQPWQALTLALMSFLSVFLFGLFSSIAYTFLFPSATGGLFSSFPLLYFLMVTFFSLFLFYFVSRYPQRLANQWRLKASSQMVPAILYVVVYMRHTANLEKAVSFAAQHLEYPLALDFRKIFYDVEVGKFSTIKESLDYYLEGWRDYSVEFIESFHLIESSLFEPDSGRRILTLEKALQVVLDGVYDKMLKFSHDVRSPLTNVYMLGVVLPTLALALLPLASAMIGDLVKWYHVVLLFNILIPFIVLYMTDSILMLRPGGHGESSLLERNPYYSEYLSKGSYFTAGLLALPFFLIAFLPLLMQWGLFTDLTGLSPDITFSQLGLGFLGDAPLFDFRLTENGSLVGPFGFGALLMSFCFPVSLAIFFSYGAKARTKNMILARDSTKQLEGEFTNSLFQLGNRVGNGMPPELAFGVVAQSSRGLQTEAFFQRVNYNIRSIGMSVEAALFDPQRGALVFFPSTLIATSMRVLVEASKKGLRIAAVSLMSISEYVKNITKITDRLRDLLAEIVSDMKSNMTFLAPLLSGVVIGLAAMITAIVSQLDLAALSGNLGSTGLGNLSVISDLFSLTQMIPPYYLQLSVSLYLLQIVFILTATLVSIDSGNDPLAKTHQSGRYAFQALLLYTIVGALASIVLFALSSVVIGGSLG